MIPLPVTQRNEFENPNNNQKNDFNPETIKSHTNIGQSAYDLQSYRNLDEKSAKLMTDSIVNGSSPQINRLALINNKIFSDYGANKHNPVINPVPFNIQNPYILKELNKYSLNTSSNPDLSRNNDRKYFGNIASINLVR